MFTEFIQSMTSRFIYPNRVGEIVCSVGLLPADQLLVIELPRQMWGTDIWLEEGLWFFPLPLLWLLTALQCIQTLENVTKAEVVRVKKTLICKQQLLLAETRYPLISRCFCAVQPGLVGKKLLKSAWTKSWKRYIRENLALALR